MHFKTFRVDNYRAISSAELPVGNNLIPLIGINESGKTSLLQAILAFDKFSDRYGGGSHLDFRNKYTLGRQDCSISADVIVDSEQDLDHLSQKLRLSRGHPILTALEEVQSAGRPITITRTLSLPHRPYSLSGLDIPEPKNRKVAIEIYRILPFLLYFDDFTDRVPEYIEYQPGDTRHRLRNSKLGEWDRILREIFNRATNGAYTLQRFIAMTNTDARDGLLSDINDVLNEEVVSAWRKLKSLGGNFADDQIDLQLQLRYSTEGKNIRFEFKVSDRSTDRQRFFNVIDRSKGFQWFFNFQMKLRFNPKYQQVKSGAIYLLDEPGSYLHSSAQEELLQTLQDISETNSIVYCTHSQHLLDPDRINIGQTKIVSKEKGEISLTPFGSVSAPKYQGALTPLYDALHLRTGAFDAKVEHAIITEGITDYYFFQMLLRHCSDWDFKRITVIPGAGANNLKDLISFAIAFCNRHLVLLDSDDQGTQAYERYTRFFGSHELPNFVLYKTPTLSENVELEDFLSKNDRDRLLQTTGCADPKRALADLYFAPKKTRKAFWKGLDSATVNNLSLTRERIETLNSAE